MTPKNCVPRWKLYSRLAIFDDTAHPEFSVIISFLAAVLSTQTHASTLLSDDFGDGNARDGQPATWVIGAFPDGERAVIDGNYVLDLGDAMDMSSYVELDHEDVSIRTQVRFLTDQDTFDFAGIWARDNLDDLPEAYWAGIRSDGLLASGMRTSALSSVTKSFVESSLDPIGGDVFLQLDVLDETIRLTAWSVGTTKPDQPQLVFTDSLFPHGGALGVFASGFDDGRNSPAAFRFFEVTDESDLPGQSISIVSPPHLEKTEGSSSTPCGCESFRYQQIFPAEYYDALNGPARLTEFAWRPDAAVSVPRDLDLGRTKIQISTTDTPLTAPILDFNANLQNDIAVVYDGPLAIQTDNVGPSTGPKEFDYVFDIENSFIYDPERDGNLVIDYTFFDGITEALSVDAFGSDAETGLALFGPVGGDHDGVVSGVVIGAVHKFTFETLPLQAGDADRDFDFDQLDLVKVQTAAKFLTGRQATWGEGDWDGAPGGQRGTPPAGNGFFDQNDIIAALGAGLYLTGPYAAIRKGGPLNDEQTSLVYDANTGELAVDAPVHRDLTSINITSASRKFIGDKPTVLDGAFDNFDLGNLFKATFGGSFGSINFGAVLPVGMSQADVTDDLSAVGSLAGGGDLGEVDLVYVPEPSTFFTMVLVTAGMLLLVRRIRRQPTT